MTRQQQIIVSIGALVGGLLLCGFSMTTTDGPPVANASVVLGLVVSVCGFISLILALKRSG